MIGKNILLILIITFITAQMVYSQTDNSLPAAPNPLNELSSLSYPAPEEDSEITPKPLLPLKWTRDLLMRIFTVNLSKPAVAATPSKRDSAGQLHKKAVEYLKTTFNPDKFKLVETKEENGEAIFNFELEANTSVYVAVDISSCVVTRATKVASIYDANGRLVRQEYLEYRYRPDGTLDRAEENTYIFGEDGKISQERYVRSYFYDNGLPIRREETTYTHENGVVVKVEWDTYTYEYDGALSRHYHSTRSYSYYSNGKLKQDIYEQFWYDGSGNCIDGEIVIDNYAEDGRLVSEIIENYYYDERGLYMLFVRTESIYGADGRVAEVRIEKEAQNWYSFGMSEYGWPIRYLEETHLYTYGENGMVERDDYTMTLYDDGGHISAEWSGITTYAYDSETGVYREIVDTIELYAYSPYFTRHEFATEKRRFDRDGRLEEYGFTVRKYIDGEFSYGWDMRRIYVYDDRGQITRIEENWIEYNGEAEISSYYDMTADMEYYDNGNLRSGRFERRTYTGDGIIKDWTLRLTHFDEAGKITDLRDDRYLYDAAGNLSRHEVWTKVVTRSGNGLLLEAIDEFISYDGTGYEISKSRTRTAHIYDENQSETEMRIYSDAYRGGVLVYTETSVYVYYVDEANPAPRGPLREKTVSYISYYSQDVVRNRGTSVVKYDTSGAKMEESSDSYGYYESGTLRAESHNLYLYNASGACIRSQEDSRRYDEGGAITTWLIYSTAYTYNNDGSYSFEEIYEDKVRGEKTEHLENHDPAGTYKDIYNLNSKFNPSGILISKTGDIQTLQNDVWQRYSIVYDVGANGEISYTHVYDANNQELGTLGGDGFRHPSSIIELIYGGTAASSLDLYKEEAERITLQSQLQATAGDERFRGEMVTGKEESLSLQHKE